MTLSANGYARGLQSSGAIPAECPAVRNGAPARSVPRNVLMSVLAFAAGSVGAGSAFSVTIAWQMQQELVL